MELLKHNLILFIFLIASTFLVSCGKNMPQEIQSASNSLFQNEKNTNLVIEENFISSSNKTIRKIKYDTSIKRTLVFISSVGCMACLEEHQSVMQEINNKTLDTTKFDMITLMINGDLNNSFYFMMMNYFLEDSGQSWPIGEDRDRKYFGKFCKKGTTPCVAILEPNEGVVFQHDGIADINDLKKHLNK